MAGEETTASKEGAMNKDHDDDEEFFTFQSSSQLIEANPEPAISKVLGQGFVFDHHASIETRLGKGWGFSIVRVHHDNVLVGRASFHAPPTIYFFCAEVEVEPEHRRKGIASAMYVLAEKIFSKTARRNHSREEGTQTELGFMLWANPNRPFGKAD